MPIVKIQRNHYNMKISCDAISFISGIYSIDDAIEAFEANKSRENLKILVN